MTGSPVVALNQAVAVGMADGPLARVAAIEAIEGRDEYHLFHAARGELLLRAGDLPSAVESFRRAHELAQNLAEQRHLDRRMVSSGRLARRRIAATLRPGGRLFIDGAIPCARSR